MDDLRRHFRRQRRHFVRTAHTAQLLVQFHALDRPTAWRRCASYLALSEEADPSAINQFLLATGRQCFLPCLDGQHMRFAPWQGDPATLHRNALGIAEPAATPDQTCMALELDLILLPLVAYDDHGTRLGMGGGFYDRALAKWPQHPPDQRPHLLGVALSCQRSHSPLPRRNWDIPLQGIITECAWQCFAREPA